MIEGGGGAALDVEIHDRAGFVATVPRAFEAAIARGARTIVCADPDFTDWPLDRPELIEALAAWLRRPLRRLVMFAHSYEGMDRAHARFSAWRRDWLHAIDPRSPADRDADPPPTLLLDDGPVVLTLWERDPPKGRAVIDAHVAASARQRIDAALQRSVAAWPLKPPGL